MSTEAWIYTVWKYGQDKNECLGDYTQKNAEKKLKDIGGEDFGFISKQQIFISGIGGTE
jgi:photosystem II stability/assembly factor-like uncharacterized protein